MISRRVFLRTGTAATGLACGLRKVLAFDASDGVVVGEPTGEKVGQRVLADGGNAIDAIVAAALASTVAAPHQTGIGGYGAHGVLAVDGGKRIVAIDANSAAPAAMQPDVYRPDAQGKVPGGVNDHGWLSAGVPGILAGLQLALDRFGSRKFGELAQPAIALARGGITWPASLSGVVANSRTMAADAGSRRLYWPDGKPPAPGTTFKNPALADLLTTLAQANSVEAFYRGDIAQQIAQAFQQHGGLVTAQDLANYQARLVDPLTLTIGSRTIHTAPLSAGGLTMLQILRAMQAMNWDTQPIGLPRTKLQIEAMRLAWHDRLALLGDTERSRVSQARLLSPHYANECAEQILAAVKAGKPLAHATTPRDHGGTISLSAADRQGNFAALTLTHGNSFGAHVTVEGLGLTLGHGMSRFDPRPDHPNAPGPGKRPLNNMSPTIVTEHGQPVLAVGGRGGRKIPNALLECLAQFALLDQPLAQAIAAPRIHTEGALNLELEKHWSAEEVKALADFGYSAKTGGSATLSAVARENGALRAAMR